MRTDPCEGLVVVEVLVGVSELGLGLAGALPGMILADLGARVTRVVGPEPVPLDEGLSWSHAWNRDKRVVTTDDPDEIRALLAGADVALVYGPERLVEGRGLGYRDLRAAYPALVYARCTPSRTARGVVADYGLLVEADAGFCTQLAGHRPGPIFVDVHASGVGAAALLLVSVLALLLRRTETEAGGWSETSLYDGLLVTLGCMIGRSERAAPEVESYWEHGSTFPNFLYRCADDELIQVWFGGKGMYRALIEVLGDEPSTSGYYQDQVTGALGERAARWVPRFATRPRDEWVMLLRAAGIACEPVLAPGEVLADPHLAEIGLIVERGRDTMVGSPIQVRPLGDAAPHRKPLGGLRVVDFSAFVAGPLAAQVLADLGADVIKVEPPEGEAMRAAAYAIAACQRGKRSLALNLGAPEARPVVERLIAGADVVLHNFRVGVAERLGIGADAVAALNPHAVYCHASAFGVTGERAALPGNDALMQALTGFERAIAGPGNEPTAGTWIPIDMTGGWVAAIGALTGLLARATSCRGQHVVTSLLGAGCLLHSGVFQRDGRVVRGPELDAEQTGYGPGYRLYRGGDGAWFALVVPDPESWARLGELIDGLPTAYAPLRSHPDARRAETVLTEAFATAPAAEWAARVRSLGAFAEPVAPLDRDGFRRGVLDDPVNRRLGRAIEYSTHDWGRFEQVGPLLRFGPDAGRGPRLILPGVGEHTVEVLTELGFAANEIEALLDAKIAAASGL
ncbi:CaiB/BaiF CoA-transferase family protein [Cryptosporangium aurantiacum]|uniref:Crotonobetainyl-CoA:carnitine CoA-transferase CaiB n=1 Tax=Cryptosporangium aurantiacum TaxID=134849 RepID=A0A1M7KJ88_9ACTN|nr:CoA transferase [Cryptosporangium aurantiacum]SHM65328.1 Crotonobetainyl-CoA:carnitine CoA-transferase CaiB [Cryptosporangium aurantiacum]